MPVLQSLAQARDKWSENQAGAIWDASIVKIILGGASNSKDLQDLSTLIGERDEFTDPQDVAILGRRPHVQPPTSGSASKNFRSSPMIAWGFMVGVP